MRPYVIELAVVFAAGVCVGVFLAEHDNKPKPAEQTTPADTPKKKEDPAGVFVSMSDGKIIIDPSRRKKWFGRNKS